MKIRSTAVVLLLTMLLTMLPFGAFAAEDDQLTEQQFQVLQQNLDKIQMGADCKPTEAVSTASLACIASPLAVRGAGDNTVLPSLIMDGMSAMIEDTMYMQFVLNVVSSQHQAAFVQVYYEEIADANYVAGHATEYPKAKGVYEWDVDWDTSGERTGSYVVAIFSANYVAGKWEIISDTIYQMNANLTDSSTPLSAVSLRDMDTDAVVTSATVSLDDPHLICYASIEPRNTTVDRRVHAESSNEELASVETCGGVLYIEALMPGACDITATVFGKTATLHLTIPSSVTDLTMEQTELTLHEGKSSALQINVTPADAIGQVSWSTSDPTVATVSKSGLVTAVGGGTAVITAKSGERQAVCTVTVTPHEYETSHTDLSCTTPDATVYTCTICGYVKQDVHTPPLGHNWDSGVVATAPTQTESGVLLLTCTRCGQTRTRILPPTSGCPVVD